MSVFTRPENNDGIDTQLNMLIDTYTSGIETLSGTYLRFEQLQESKIAEQAIGKDWTG